MSLRGTHRNNNKNNEEEDHDDVRFVVTGFGPFNGVPSNPTTVIVDSLIDFLTELGNNKKDSSDSTQSQLFFKLASTTRTLILETSAEEVTHAVDQLDQEDEEAEEAEKTSPLERTTTIYLHLGVNYVGTQFQLEQYAYNNANFRVPDEKGYQPQQTTIVPDQPLETRNETALDVHGLVSRLRHERNHNKTTVSVSTNPGRFVCNYAYCYSLNKLQGNYSETTDAPSRCCLFVHVPPFSVASKQQQLEFVVNLMTTIYKLQTPKSSKVQG